jgi:capsular polysaccharide biosynthesis protein
MRMDVARYLAIGRRWWWLLIIGVMFSLAAYGLVARLHLRTPAPPTYAASTTLFATLPTPDAAFPIDSARRPWEMDRLMATYGQMVKTRTVAERAVLDAGLSSSPDDLAGRITSDTFGYTQLLRVTVAGPSAGEADRSLAAVVRAFGDVRAERAIPGDAAVFETSPAVRTDTPASELVNIGIVIFAGLVSAASIVIVFEYLGGGVREAGDTATAGERAGATRPLAGNERA